MSNLVDSVPESSQEEFSKLLEESFVSNACEEGQVIKGTVVGIESDTIIVDVGMKTEVEFHLMNFRPLVRTIIWKLEMRLMSI